MIIILISGVIAYRNGFHLWMVDYIMKNTFTTECTQILEISLDYAIKYGMADVVFVLAPYSNDLDTPSRLNGQTKIGTAVIHGHLEVLTTLLPLVQDANKPPFYGKYALNWTPMHEAVARAHPDMVVALIPFCKGNPNPPDRFGKTPHQIAVERMFHPEFVAQHGRYQFIAKALEKYVPRRNYYSAPPPPQMTPNYSMPLMRHPQPPMMRPVMPIMRQYPY